MSMCRVFSCAVGRGCLLWPGCSLGKTLLPFVLLHFVLQGQTCLLLQVSLDFLLLQSNPLWWKGHLFLLLLLLVLEGLGGLHRTIRLQHLQHERLEHRLGLLWCWTEITLSFLRLHLSTAFRTLVDYEGYSISSKGFLPTVVDTVVIWVKFTHSHPFQFTLTISCLTPSNLPWFMD